MNIECTNCNKKFVVPDEYKGRKAKCSQCGHILLIGASEQEVVQQKPPIPPEKNVMPTKLKEEICANCNRVLGKLEQAFIFKGNVVCASCNNILTNSPIPTQKENILQISRDNLKFIFGILGAAMLAIGVFLPIIRIPIVGSVNYFRNGKGDGVIILILAAITLLCTLMKKYKLLWLTGLFSLGLLAFTFLNFHIRASEANSNLRNDLSGNPFSGLGEIFIGAVQLDYGWIVLIIGGLLTIAAAAIKENTVKKDIIYNKRL